YVDRAIAYASEALADTTRERFGRKIRQAAKRFLDDLRRAEQKRPPFRFSREHANHACQWIELLPHVEGRWETPKIRLHVSHVFFVVHLVGFRKLDSPRRLTPTLSAGLA